MNSSDGDNNDNAAGAPRFTADPAPPPAPGAAVALDDADETAAGDGDTKSSPGPDGGWQAATAVPALQGSSADQA